MEIKQENLQKEIPQKENNGTERDEVDVIPPQWKGVSSEVLEEIWTITEYVDSEKTKSEKERKEKALAFLREQELSPQASRNELEKMKIQQEVVDGEGIEDIRKKLGIEQENLQNLANVRICKQVLDAAMTSTS